MPRKTSRGKSSRTRRKLSKKKSSRTRRKTSRTRSIRTRRKSNRTRSIRGKSSRKRRSNKRKISNRNSSKMEWCRTRAIGSINRIARHFGYSTVKRGQDRAKLCRQITRNKNVYYRVGRGSKRLSNTKWKGKKGRGIY